MRIFVLSGSWKNESDQTRNATQSAQMNILISNVMAKKKAKITPYGSQWDTSIPLRIRYINIKAPPIHSFMYHTELH